MLAEGKEQTMFNNVYCVGYKRVYYAGDCPAEEAFDYENGICEKNILCCYIERNNGWFNKFEISLETDYGWCGSGYTTATHGVCNAYWVSDFGSLTHVPIGHKPILIEGVTAKDIENLIRDGAEDDIENNVFEFDYDGGDSYYPRGYAGVNEDLFECLPRAFDERPVWVLHGEPATGKTTLAHILDGDKRVYETDSCGGNLPDELWYDVIVVGNKWPNVTLEEVYKRIGTHAKIISVNFSSVE